MNNYPASKKSKVVFNFDNRPLRKTSRTSSVPDLTSLSYRRQSRYYNDPRKLYAGQMIKDDMKNLGSKKVDGILDHALETKSVLFIFSAILLILSILKPDYFWPISVEPKPMSTRGLLQELQRQLNDDQVEISWDEQHIFELQEQIQQMDKSFTKTLEERKKHEEIIEKEVAELGMTLDKVEQERETVSTKDRRTIVTLTESLDKSYQERSEQQGIIEQQQKELIQLKTLVAQKCKVSMQPANIVYQEEHHTPSGIVVRSQSDVQFRGSVPSHGSFRGRA